MPEHKHKSSTVMVKRRGAEACVQRWDYSFSLYKQFFICKQCKRHKGPMSVTIQVGDITVTSGPLNKRARVVIVRLDHLSYLSDKIKS
jgi:hypothetical protein